MYSSKQQWAFHHVDMECKLLQNWDKCQMYYRSVPLIPLDIF